MTDPTNYPEILQEIAEPAIRAYREGNPATTLRPEDALCLCAAASMIRSLAAESEQLRAILSGIQWTARVGPDGDPGCPICGGHEDLGHDDDCRLKAAIT